VSVYFIVGRIEELFPFGGVGGMDVFALYYPDRDAFIAAGIHIAGILDGHLCVSSVQGTSMLMVEAGFTADENFPEWPFILEVALSAG
jgi:hypothetical protein